jgi:threonine dehydrogenase-like Zn-dependent dehydrogenase
VRALCWTGMNQTSVETVDDPTILNDHDVIVKVRLTTTCGSDLHLLGGYIPAMRAGDILGHEFMGEVVEIGRSVTKHRVGDRVVVCSFISCGRCWYCSQQLYSLCDNGNPNPALTETLWGSSSAGCFAYSQALGGFAGSHAEYIRVPYADQGAFAVPDGVSDLSALFASDAAPTAWTGVDLVGIEPGDTVAVWGAGAVGQLVGWTLDYSRGHVAAELRERTGGRGPDVCIEAVGMEAHGTGPSYLYDQMKQQLRLQTDRPTALREAIYACRKGGRLFVLGVFVGWVDKFPLGAIMNKGLTVRAAQQHGHRYIPTILDRIAAGHLRTEHLATHLLPLEDGPRGYDLFKNKQDGCVRAVFQPSL